MSARYPYFILADTPEGRAAEAELSGHSLPPAETSADVRHRLRVRARSSYHAQFDCTVIHVIGDARGRSTVPCVAMLKLELLLDKPHKDSKEDAASPGHLLSRASPHRSLAFAGTAVVEPGPRSRSSRGSPTIATSRKRTSSRRSSPTSGYLGIRPARRRKRGSSSTRSNRTPRRTSKRSAREDAPDQDSKARGDRSASTEPWAQPSYQRGGTGKAIKSRSLDLLCILAFAFSPLPSGRPSTASPDAGFDVAPSETRTYPRTSSRMNADLVMGRALATSSPFPGEPDVVIKKKMTA